MSNILADASFAYNSTVSCPPFDILYFKIPVLSDEAAFKAGLNKLKVLHTCWSSQLKGATLNEKLIDLARNLSRASPWAYDIIKTHCPSWYAILNPRGGKVPTTYLFKQLGERVEIIGGRLAERTAVAAAKTLEKEIVAGAGRILMSCLGADLAAVEKIFVGIAEKVSNNILAKLVASPQVQWAWIAGWIGLIIGSAGYALLEVVGLNQALFQSWMVPIFNWYYDVPAKEREGAEMRTRLAQMQITLYHKTLETARQAGAEADVIAAITRAMKPRLEAAIHINI